ncbi:Hsp20/alpha crystallin family protein [Candidatus Phytoplasma melaleucae]|uniref:Hsp20/alpha crystallin family protein n=1 Tax=Candidatus Phytoplasma melaleucae TaxID=2982630 RepID=A0ABT9DE48_9MOLU|nr:Hsp20/alpha crystallin family protein ['Melaleuca sp.' phytoplasma]MDO8167947.1 Hsp20/alpha crystallin family protein ['Melaleuca sp.' phytoplasma]MDV3205145.1 Hsp20/alpha crystallin family protein [Weeping tea tree witches'-broom phytoplasma]
MSTLLHLFNQNKDLIENFLDDVYKNENFAGSVSHFAKTDIYKWDNFYEIIIEMPGFTKEDIQIYVQNDWLVVEAKPKEKPEYKEENKSCKLVQKERISGMIRRSFRVVEGLSINDIQGNLENGLLTLKVKQETQEQHKKEYLKLK